MSDEFEKNETNGLDNVLHDIDTEKQAVEPKAAEFSTSESNTAEADRSTQYRYTREQMYGQNRQNAYQQGTYQQNPYQQNSYQQNTYRQNAYQQNTYRQNAYQQSAYNQNSAQQSAYSQNSSQQNAYQQAAAAKPQRKKKKEKRSANTKYWAKVVCAGLVFGLVAGVIFEGIDIAGDRVFKKQTPVVETTATSATVEGPLEVVKVSSREVETIEAGDVSDIVKEVMPSIVSVNVVVEKTMQDFFGRIYSQEGKGAGSGFIFSQNDEYLYIATNNHVVENSKSISVTFSDDSSADAVVKGTDPDEDVAVVQVPLSELSDETKAAIKVAVLGDSSELEAGDGAIAIGNALGYGQSVTTGAISAVERSVQLTDGAMNLIQTSAAINPGNSGGPLLNTKGEVIGINTVKFSETTVEGMGFAIPINSAVETINSLLLNNQTTKADDTPIFGIKGGNVTEAIAEQTGYPQGIYVSYVYAGSSAATAGITQGDIIVGFDGHEITTIEELQDLLAEHKPGDQITVDVYVMNSDGTYSGPQSLLTILGSKADLKEEY